MSSSPAGVITRAKVQAFEGLRVEACEMVAQDRHLDVLRRGKHAELEHEAVKLRLGQGIGALRLDGILRGHDQERLGQWARDTVDGDLALLHGFEQGRLGLGRRAVDFVGEQELREHGALEKIEGALC
jgi:hypothetical protein